jgi:hypothetical protein
MIREATKKAREAPSTRTFSFVGGENMLLEKPTAQLTPFVWFAQLFFVESS